ncbi:methyltransferase-like protein 25B isoform X2 [Octopus bimaculoides]|uniref:methyltransferase-like protein 25B isoform X2 n=1 Tax=Octopus bimaculoides TaxID=37653 RepID=UPI0022E6B24D|nr:methyltransferase-like protein 25B isoform X2 [Octopus bimaculoides]
MNMAERDSVFALPSNIDSVVSVKQHIQKILQFLKIYGWVLDIYVSDFFVLNHWEKLLPSWRDCFQKMTTSDVAELLTVNKNTKSKIILPLSLLACRSCIQSLSLKRTIASDKGLSYVLEALTSNTYQKISAHLPTMYHVTDDPTIISDIKCSGGQYVSLDAYYRKHVKPKKQHEIHQMSKVIGDLCHIIKCDKVVDVGAGLGHLSRLLNFKYNLTVTTVEATGGHAAKAHKFDLDLFNMMKKRKKEIQDSEQKSEGTICYNTTEKKTNLNLNDTSNHATSLPYHVIHQVVNNISPKDFLEMLKMPRTCEFDSSQKVNLFDTFQPFCLSNTNSGEHYTSKENSTVNFHLNYGSMKEKDILPSPYKQSSNYRQIRRTCSESNLSHSVTTFKENSVRFCTKSSNSLNLFDEKLILKKPSVFANQLVLCGLHACGDLTTTLIQMFTQNQDISALAVVGCCYMKLSTSSNCSLSNNASWGYPMSQHLQTLQHRLTYEARELACHFVDAYHKRLLENRPSLRRHWYRASLQCVVKAIQPTFKHGCIKISIKNVENLSFEVYLEKALKSLGFSISQVPPGIIDQCKATENQWKDIVCFYTLRLSIAPVIETLVLLDRMLYILESVSLRQYL